MTGLYECTSCGVVAGSRQGLCHPREVNSRNEYCGETPPGKEMMCESMRESLEYECGGCGRPTADPNLVCMAEKKG